MNQKEIKRKYYYDKGLLYSLKTGRIVKAKSPDGYLRITLGFDVIPMHRAIWVYFNGDIPKDKVIDHINNDKLDNRIENLQCIDKTTNLTKDRHLTNSSSYLYISEQNGKYIVNIPKRLNFDHPYRKMVKDLDIAIELRDKVILSEEKITPKRNKYKITRNRNGKDTDSSII